MRSAATTKSSLAERCRSFFVLLAPLHGGALALVLVLGLALVPTATKDHPNCLLAGGMVRGDVEQVTGGTGL